MRHIRLTVDAILTGECKKAAKILTSFVDPRQSFGPDKVIPPEILANAKVRKPIIPTLRTSMANRPFPF
jgi:lipid-binding SYLF domain-containing protein